MIKVSEVTAIETIKDVDKVETPYFALQCKSDDFNLTRVEKGDVMIFKKSDAYNSGDVAITTTGDCVEVTVDTPDYMLVGKLEEVRVSRF